MLDSFELHTMLEYAYGDHSNESVTDNLITSQYDFARFYTEALTKRNQMAFLILTGKQYVFARNCGEGKQGHILSITKAFLEIEGKNPDITLRQAVDIYNRYDKNHLIFSIEIRFDDRSGRYEQVMRATLHNGLISPQEYQSFKNFYDEYGEVIRKSNLKFDLWNTKEHKSIPIKNIDKLNKYLTTVVDENAKPFDLGVEEKIIGVSTIPQQPNQVLRKCCKNDTK